MLVFLSSAPLNRPRYADDIVRVLALPAGAQMQFRYAREWVAPEILGRIPRERLADERILICFLAGDGVSQPFEIVPLRYARLIRAELVGTSCLFIFEAGEFVSNLDDAAVRSAVPSTIASMLPGPSPASKAFFVFECGLHARGSFGGANLRDFENAVGRVSAFPPFNTSDTVFFTLFRLSRLRKFSWFGTWPRPRSPSRLKMGSYVLPSGGRYECEVYCLKPNDAPTGVPPAKLRLTIAAYDDQLTFVSATQGDVDSEYDVKRFLCQSEFGILDRLTGFRIFLKNETDGTVARDISVPVVLRRSFLLGPTKALLILIATAGSAMLAANAAGKLDQITGALIVALAAFAGVAAVFPSIKKP